MKIGKFFLFAACISLVLASCASSPEALRKTPPGVSDSIIESLDIWESERLAEATKLMETAAASLNEAHLYYLLSYNYKQADETPKAEAALKKAIALDPGFARALYELTKIQIYELGNISRVEAEANFEKASRLRPENEEIALHYLDYILWDDRQAGKTQKAFDEFFSYHPRSVSGYLSYLIFLDRSNRQTSIPATIARIKELARTDYRIHDIKHAATRFYEMGYLSDAAEMEELLLGHPELDDWILEYLESYKNPDK